VEWDEIHFSAASQGFYMGIGDLAQTGTNELALYGHRPKMRVNLTRLNWKRG
jgi:hypothetical protein